ncbi:hypothetical protein ERVG_00449 [Emiliania huxleyi virus 208]|nr:hypothetical protein ERVG_00411 [Emiliania huxleyi virus 208]AEP16322.1 hypothetical protein ERVG_00449 [Emiliania huxleyi virus 208]
MNSLAIVHAINEFLSIDTPTASGHVIINALQTGFRLETELLTFRDSGIVMPAFYTQMSDEIAIKLGEMSAKMRARKTQKRVRNMRRAMVTAGVIRVM